MNKVINYINEEIVKTKEALHMIDMIFDESEYNDDLKQSCVVAQKLNFKNLCELKRAFHRLS